MGTKTKKKNEKNVLDDGLLLLITVVQKNKLSFYLDFLEQYQINLQLHFLGTGTAPNEVISMLKLDTNEKRVIFSVINQNQEKAIIEKLDDKFHQTRNGNGIAFTVPLNSIIGVYAYQFLSNSRDFKIRKGEKENNGKTI